MHRMGWQMVVFFATGVALYALAVLLVPGVGPPFVALRRADLPLPLAMHLAGGATALATGAWQLDTSLRARRPALHRWLGRLYILAVFIGGIGGAILAPASMFGRITHFGFGGLAFGWLLTTGAAYLQARAGDFAAHRRWVPNLLVVEFWLVRRPHLVALEVVN